jgi:hypothetical protein
MKDRWIHRVKQWSDDIDWMYLTARKLAVTPCMTTHCPCCTNPRKWDGSITLDEKINNLNFKEYGDEIG